MLTPEQLAYCADDMVRLYSQLDEAIVRDIARRITKAGTMTETGRFQINALQNVGMLYDDILKTVSSYTGKSESVLFDLFENAALWSVEYDMDIYAANGLNPIPLNMSPAAMQVLEAGYIKTNGNINNLTRTTAVTAQTSFIDACTFAEMKAESGAFSYEQAIADAIKQIAIPGGYVLYPSGHKDRIDVAVRRNVMTGVGQTTGQICLGYAQDMGCDLMEITAHCGARPSHASWQGQIVSLSGRKGYLSLSDIGYGTGDGFKGWNCRHDWYPYFEGSPRMYSEKDIEELNAENIKFPDGSMHTYYEAEQYQRAYERKIRETKRILAAQDECIINTKSESLKKSMQNNFDEFSIKLKKQEAKLNDFCDKTGLLKDNARVQKYGFGRGAAQRAVRSYKKEVEKYTKYHYNKDGSIVVTDDWKGKKANNIPKVYKPYAVVETKTIYRNGMVQIDRSFYNEKALLSTQVHSSHHNKPKLHPYGTYGEHSHNFIWDDEGNQIIERTTRELNDKERKENKDILWAKIN